MTALDTTAAAAWLLQTAKASRLTFTPETLQAAAEQLAGTVERDPAGGFAYQGEAGAAAFRVEGGQVVEIPVMDHLVGIILAHTKPAETAPTPGAPAQIAGPSPAARDYRDRFGSKATAASDAALAAEVQTWANPFDPKHPNRTRQTVLRNRFPELAARYEMEATQ